MPDRSRHLALIPQSASHEEAAAIVAAIERFMRATTRPAQPAQSEAGGWRRTALLEAISRAPSGDAADPWINT